MINLAFVPVCPTSGCETGVGKVGQVGQIRTAADPLSEAHGSPVAILAFLPV